MLVEIVTEEPPSRVRLERERHGDIPLGCTVAREETALQALEAGADEAMVLPNAEPRAIHTLFDRMLLRASLRREGERMSASVGHADKLAALGTLVAGVAHEINNPLTILTLSTALLRKSNERVVHARDELERLVSLGRAVQPEELRRVVEALPGGRVSRGVDRALDDMARSIDAVTDVVRDLRVFARIDEDTPPEWLDVGELVDHVLRIVRREIERIAILERDIPPDLPRLYVPRTRLVQVLTNVLINAAHAVREVDRPVHRVRISARADDEAIAIVVTDTGPGIASSDIDRIFDPFFTTKRQHLGTGLGLSISRSILRGIGGDMLVDSVHGDGATFVLMVPLADQDPGGAVTEVVSAAPSSLSERRQTVLVVGARDAMVRAYGRALAEDYDLVVAGDADEAVELLRTGTRADVVLVEGAPSDFDARRVHGWLERERPQLANRTIFVASEPTAPTGPSSSPEILHKPVSRERLLQALERVTDRSDEPTSTS